MRSRASLSLYLSICLSVACDPPGEDISVPRSNTCNEGVFAQDCVSVPPRFAGGWTIDGNRGPAEYWGAVELPMPNIQARDTAGRVFVTLDVNADTAESTLLLFFDQVGLAPNTESFAAHFDFERWQEDPAVMSNSDRRFLIDLATGATSSERPTTIFGTTLWSADAVTEPLYQAALGTCTPATGAIEQRCDIEMAIPMPPEALIPPAEGLAPGVGFAVSDSIRAAALPEELSSAELAPFEEVLFDRSEYISLIFKKPEGVPFTFLSWNVAHWGSDLEWRISGSPFEPVAISQLAEVMYPYDIIAIQEMWDRDDAIGLRNTVNNRRAAAGLPPMQLIGPASHPPAFLQLFGGGLFGDGHAGLFILSRFPVIAQDSTGYEDCRGEDCFKPKGVQWARLALRTPTAEDLSSNCRQHVPGSSCPTTPTSEMYIDVFNTHMQARNPQLCDLTPNDRIAYWAVLLGGCEAVPIRWRRPVDARAQRSSLAIFERVRLGHRPLGRGARACRSRLGQLRSWHLGWDRWSWAGSRLDSRWNDARSSTPGVFGAALRQLR